MPAKRNVPAAAAEPRLRRAYFECRFGQLHVHHAIPSGGGFDERTALICIPDAGSTARALLPLLASLGRSRSVYAPDPPGCGESDASSGQDAVAASVGAINDFIADMRLRQVDLLGIGSGAAVARALATQRQAEVRRLVLVGEQRTDAPRSSQPRLELPAAEPAALARDARLEDFLK